MSRFDSVSLAPADPILSLTEAFKSDLRPDKINLSVGVFVDDSGATPVLESVKEAERRIVAQGASKSYLPITGTAAYSELTRKLCFGEELGASLASRAVSLQSPGGTGALRVAADFIARNLPAKTVWLSDPTWANHKGIFEAAGLATRTYAYFDKDTLGLDFESCASALSQIPENDIVLLHGCCHNPTGADLSSQQWQEIAQIAASRGWIPFIDFAYQGFGDDLETDATAARLLAAAGLPLFVAHSFSKNLGLYQDRVGALHVIVDDPATTERVASQLKIAVRVNYSNPPAHGGAIVATILSDTALRAVWQDEVTAMRERINGVRGQFVDALAAAEVGRDFSFLKRQKGMFSFTGLGKEQARALREDWGIYIVDSGRINVAGITTANIGRVVSALKALVG